MTNSRNRKYIMRTRDEKKSTRHYINICKAYGETVERDIVDKLKFKKGGKHRDEVIRKESMCDVYSSDFPTF